MSGNHGGALDKCIRLLHAACDTGADAIKLQAYRPDTITLKSDKEDFAIASDNAWAKHKNLYELYEQAHTPWEWFPTLFEEAGKRGVELFGSVFDETSVDELEKYPCKAYKIASPEIVDMGLIQKVAATGKPVIVSTGLAVIDDITQAVGWLRDAGCNDIILLKCTSAYPTPPEEVHLKTMKDMEEKFGCYTGFSDHTTGIGVSIGAVALGAKVIEKHVMLDDGEETVDSFFSLSPLEFQQMITEIRRAEKAIGRVYYDLSDAAAKNKSGKRSLYVSKDIKKGDLFTNHNIKSVRPSYGLAPKHKPEVIGRTANVDLEVGDRLSWDVID
ncbi:MAG: pseudaminic acid synthase [Emcibacteraceae bacterium]|nr:pseudaminic acid synthase [Emcibacteraceae bacterium]